MMRRIALALALLLASAADAHAGSGDDTFTWCVAAGTDGRGAVRYFSDPFTGPADEWISLSFQQYLEQHFLKKRHDLRVDCRTFDGLSAAREALTQAKAPVKGTRDVMTAWRDHFE